MKLPNWVKEFIQVGLLLDARAAVEVAPEVGSIVAKELGQNDEWAESLRRIGMQISRNYDINSYS